MLDILGKNHVCYAAVRRGECGVKPLTTLEQDVTPAAIGGEAPADPEDGSGLPREVVRLRRALALGGAVSREL